MKHFRTVQDVVDWRLCLGCGACAYICPDSRIELFNVLEEGIRPRVSDTDCFECRACLDVCPAVENDHREINKGPGLIAELAQGCGPVLEVWEGYAADPEIRRAGSSGGAITALAAYCIENAGMHGVLHIAQDPSEPLANVTTMSYSREDLLAKTGSRYAPASACDSLQMIEEGPGPCVFIGQPSEVTALRKAQALKSDLSRKVGVAISFFCAGSPATKGTQEYLRSLGVDIENVSGLRYRGNGWPGMFAVMQQGEESPSHLRTYKDSWGFVQAYRPFSTHLCPDGTGEDADISCGDPWYREVDPADPGRSMILVRTEIGRDIVRKAIEAGYVVLEKAEPWKLLASQKNLIRKRGAIWGRIAMLRLFGLPAPRLRGFSLFKNWLALPVGEMLRSTLGTVRRILTRGYLRPAMSRTVVGAQTSGEKMQCVGR